MKKYNTFFFFLFLMFSCTTNPFWDDPFTKIMRLTGTVHPEDNLTNTPAYVWLEGLELDTVTNGNKEFLIEINSTQTPAGNINGPLKIYFYLHNYRISHATIYFTDGHFSDSQIDFSSDGELLEPIALEKLVSAETLLPSVFRPALIETLRIKLDLEVHNSTTRLIGYKKVLAQNTYLPSGVIFRSLEDEGDIYINRLYNDSIFPIEYSAGSALTWLYEIDSDSLQLSQGEYEVFPFFLVEQNQVPENLFFSLGIDNTININAHYLKLPMDMVPGFLTVQ